MRRLLPALLLLGPSPASAADPPAGTLPAQWNVGAADCDAHPPPPIEVHAYDPATYVLRESLCSTFEAPFLYLLVGSREALLVDTGAVADAKVMPLADTVTRLLPAGLPLTVLHSHGHLDHRNGDGQFEGRPGVKVIPAELEPLRRHLGLAAWPEGIAQLDLGERVVDVVPAPGHHRTQVVFYDRRTGLLLTGDFLLPGRILVDDARAYLASAERVARFVADRPVTHVLGAHIERSRGGELFPWGSRHHPGERELQLGRADLAALEEELREFNGFYGDHGGFVISNPQRNLFAFGGAALLAAGTLGFGLARFLRRRRRHRALAVAA